MIVHIVMFKFFDENKEQNTKRIKQMLEDLVHEVSGLKLMEVGINFNEDNRAYDMSLYSVFDTKDDLKLYANCPAHLEVLKLLKKTVEKTIVVDYIK